MIKIAAFADEADSALKGQIEALKRNGIFYIELRGIDGKNVSLVTREEAVNYARMLNEAGIKVWSIGSPLGKTDITEDFEKQKDLLLHLCDLAVIFGTDKIRMFSFYNSYESAETVFSRLCEMVNIAAKRGIGLYHENEREIYGDTLERVCQLKEKVPGLRFVYDPANFLIAGESAAETLGKLQPHTDYFHIKDVIAETGQIVPAGYGDGLIGQLIDGIGADDEKVLTLEPHLKLFEGYAEIDGAEMKHQFEFETANEAFDAAVTALDKLLTDAGYKKTTEGYTKL